MRAVHASFTLNLASLILKLASVINATSVAVNAEFLHSLGDTIGSGLLVFGLSISKRSPSVRYPFGFGRAIYVFGLIASAILGGFLFAITSISGIQQLISMEDVSSSTISIASLTTALMLDLIVLSWCLIEFRKMPRDPASRGTVVENLSDAVGEFAALISLITSNPLIDGVGALVVSAILLSSSALLSYRYFEVLVGKSAPKNVVGRAVKIVLSDPRIIDVNDVKSLFIGPDEYLIVLQIEVPENTSVEEIDNIRKELSMRIKERLPEVKHVIIEFHKPTSPPMSFKKILKEIITLGD
ncbi:MAG: cation diffusion facilitator family transporter [Desulfurococcaceae archaeon TW002]